MRQVIFQFCREYDGRSLIELLKGKSRRDGEDFDFVDLVDVLPEGRDKEWAFSNAMGDYVGTAMIGNPYAVIWSPNPLESDWFAKLSTDRYNGKKILIHSGNLGPVKMDEEFGTHADHKIELLGRNLADKVYEALRE